MSPRQRGAGRGHRVLLLADGDKLAAECGQVAAGSDVPGLEIATFSQGRRLTRYVGAALAAARLMVFRPQALVAHEHAHPQVTALQVLGARVGRTLLIVHDPAPHAGRDADFAAVRRRQIEAQRAGAAVLLAHGDWCAAQLRQAFAPAKPIFPIAHGPILRPPAPPTAPPQGGGLLMFGRMEAYKGLDVLLQACRLLHGRGALMPLHLLGAGPELDRLGAAFAALSGVTISSGYASRERAVAAMAAAQGVVLPYTEASQSGVLAAAFANGRGVVASAVGGLPDSVRHGEDGLLVPPSDPAALAQAMQDFLPQATILGAGALAAARGRGSWASAADAIEGAARR